MQFTKKLPFSKFLHISNYAYYSRPQDLTFLGFLVMQNKLKPETTPVIEELHRASIKTVMVTGDNLMTALSVARECNMVGKNDRVFEVRAKSPKTGSNNASIEFHLSDDDQAGNGSSRPSINRE